MTTIPDTSNVLFQLAADLINQSSRNIFLTGKAGTGKTTFLKHIRRTCMKQMAVVAPTGVAAINAGGVTIHSFFQLPFSPFVPDAAGNPFAMEHEGFVRNDGPVNKHDLLSRLRLNREKLRVLEELELLIIDEISMVRSDTLDAIDTVLRHVRRKPLERFGGVQVLFIGDMYQLPPVIRDQEWRLLSAHYNSPYFFDSKVMQEQPPLYIEFEKIYRQSEESFIRVLNQVRNNQLDEGDKAILESRYDPDFNRHEQEGYIVLTTHNERVRDINSFELNNLDAKLHTYRAEIKDDFPENAYPADELLQLKLGAQVMFLKNDSSENGKRFFNGRIGTVMSLEKDLIRVKCEGDIDEIEVRTEVWENIRYTLDETTRKMKEEVLGSFIQFPLRLAWAITIHKSQGLTFEKAIIDAGEAFAAGQVYVALSRCTSLSGMILKSRIKPNSLTIDRRIIRFSQQCASSQELENELILARREYHKKLLLTTFDFSSAINSTGELEKYLTEHKSSFNEASFPWLKELSEKLSQLQVTASKFQTWMQAQFALQVSLEENTQLQAKTRDGAVHFVKEIQVLIHLLQQSPVVTDSRLHTKEFNDSARELFSELSLKVWLLNGFNGVSTIDTWHQRRKSFIVPAFTINAYGGASEQRVQSPHPILYHQLKKVRDTICSQKDLPIYMVAGSKTLDELSTFLPQTPQELEQIKGFGKSRIESYGKQFLDIIIAYCDERQLSSQVKEKEPKKQKDKAIKGETKPKKDTKAESLRLFREGMSIDAIAEVRSLTSQTIEGHLAHYVETGDINVEELVSMDKLILIEPVIKELNGGPISPVKDKLGDQVTYGDIKFVVAWSAFKGKEASNP